MNTARTRQATPRLVYLPQFEQVDTEETSRIFADRAALIEDIAQQDATVAIEPVVLSEIKHVQQIGALCCYGNRDALRIVGTLLRQLVALDDTLKTIDTNAARHARRMLDAVVLVARSHESGGNFITAMQPKHV